MKIRHLSALGALVCLPAFGQWSGDGDLGYSNSTGNTQSSSLAAALGLKYSLDQWDHAININAVGASQNGVATGERYALRGQSDYRFNDDAFAFGSFRYQSDRFSGYEYQSSLKTGLGYRLINTETRSLTGEMGVGLRRDKLTTAPSEDELVGSLALKFVQQLTQTTEIDANALTETGESNRYSELGIGLRVAISDSLGLRAAWQATQNSDVPPGSRKTDTLTTVGLNYRF
jgi:putative salt-induced outer membrane protein